MPTKTHTPSSDPSIPEVRRFSEDRFNNVDKEIDQRLDTFIGANTRLNEYYSQMVKEHPDRAIRSLMLNKMFRLEGENRLASRLAPQAREWLEKQSPEVQQRIADKIERYSPMYREKAAVKIIAEEKARLDFKPREALSNGVKASA